MWNLLELLSQCKQYGVLSAGNNRRLKGGFAFARVALKYGMAVHQLLFLHRSMPAEDTFYRCHVRVEAPRYSARNLSEERWWSDNVERLR